MTKAQDCTPAPVLDFSEAKTTLQAACVEIYWTARDQHGLNAVQAESLALDGYMNGIKFEMKLHAGSPAIQEALGALVKECIARLAYLGDQHEAGQ